MNGRYRCAETTKKPLCTHMNHTPIRGRTFPNRAKQQNKRPWICLKIGIWVVGLFLFGAIATTNLDAGDTTVAPVFSPDQRADLQRIWAYFDTLKTLTASFDQFSSNGSRASGQLYLHRPGRLRIEYQPPTPLLIIADGQHLFYYDTELNSASTFRLDETPAAIFLGESFDSEKSDWVTTALEKNPGSVRLTLNHRHHPEYGQVILVFSDQPLELRKWQIRDAEAVETVVVLHEIRQGMALEEKLFTVEDPRVLTNPFIR